MLDSILYLDARFYPLRDLDARLHLLSGCWILSSIWMADSILYLDARFHPLSQCQIPSSISMPDSTFYLDTGFYPLPGCQIPSFIWMPYSILYLISKFHPLSGCLIPWPGLWRGYTQPQGRWDKSLWQMGTGNVEGWDST